MLSRTTTTTILLLGAVAYPLPAWSHRARADEPITNTIGMKLAYVPEGEFLMGSPTNESDRDYDEEQHRVRITRPFFLGVYEVTQAEYERVMGANPSFFSRGGDGSVRVSGEDTARYPVEEVSWEDAMEFCRKAVGVACREVSRSRVSVADGSGVGIRVPRAYHDGVRFW